MSRLCGWKSSAVAVREPHANESVVYFNPCYFHLLQSFSDAGYTIQLVSRAVTGHAVEGFTQR